MIMRNLIRFGRAGVFACMLSVGLDSSSLNAFPPAPHHLFYGTVRDEQGNPLVAEGAEVILQAESGSVSKSRIISGFKKGVNYELSVPMDAGITDDLYRPTAMRPTLPFRIQVKIDHTLYLPIEMTGDFAKMGLPSEETRLNLTLGEDSDGDGLPDAWERALAQGGRGLEDVGPEDDSDGDGLSNLDEYIAGSYAFDPNDGFEVKIRTESDKAVLEFLSVRGRSYTIYGSSDFTEWVPIAFRLDSDEPGVSRSSYHASDSQVIEVEVKSDSETSQPEFFKLMAE